MTQVLHAGAERGVEDAALARVGEGTPAKTFGKYHIPRPTIATKPIPYGWQDSRQISLSLQHKLLVIKDI